MYDEYYASLYGTSSMIPLSNDSSSFDIYIHDFDSQNFWEDFEQESINANLGSKSEVD